MYGFPRRSIPEVFRVDVDADRAEDDVKERLEVGVFDQDHVVRFDVDSARRIAEGVVLFQRDRPNPKGAPSADRQAGRRGSICRAGISVRRGLLVLSARNTLH